MVVGPRLPTWYDNDAVFTAGVEASATDSLGAVANVVAGPASVVVVVGVVVVAPGLVPLAVPPDALVWSPVVVRDVPNVINSVVNPVVFNPPNCGVSFVEGTLGFAGGGEFFFDFSNSFVFFFRTLSCLDASKLSSVSSIDMVDYNKARSDEL